MELVLNITFNSRVRTSIRINNSTYIPNYGEIVDIKAEDFLTNAEEISSLNKYAENGVWLVGFKTVTYKKDMVDVLIVLEEEEHFKVNH
jgi:hypothetical protein